MGPVTISHGIKISKKKAWSFCRVFKNNVVVAAAVVVVVVVFLLEVIRPMSDTTERGTRCVPRVP